MADISGFNVGGQYVSPELYGIYEKQTHTGKASGLLVKQNTTPNMTVLVEPGIALLDKGSFSSVVAGVKSNTSLTIATANPSNPRIDAIVVYEDIAVTMPSVEPYSVDASNGRFKMVVVAGTPGAVPTAPSDPTIQSTIGAGNTSWTRLATVRVEAGTTTIVNSKIDNTIRSSLGSLLAPGQVTADKLGGVHTVLFSGSPARVVTISSTYTDFDCLVVVYTWLSQNFTSILDTSVSSHRVPLAFTGTHESSYAVISGSGTISLSGTSVTGSASIANYATRVTTTPTLTFRDNLGDVVIARVVGIKLH